MGYIKQSGLAADVPSNVPLIGINNFAGATTVSSSTAAAGFPISNVVNPATHLKWKGNSSSGDEYVTVIFGGSGIAAQPNYLGIAKHNLSSGGALVTVEGNDPTHVLLHFDQTG